MFDFSVVLCSNRERQKRIYFDDQRRAFSRVWRIQRLHVDQMVAVGVACERGLMVSCCRNHWLCVIRCRNNNEGNGGFFFDGERGKLELS